jgi:hypothetical protein
VGGGGGGWEGQMLQLCRKFSLSVGCADFRSLSFMQESGQSQANAPVYQQNGESAPAFSLWEQHFPRSLCSAAGVAQRPSLHLVAESWVIALEGYESMWRRRSLPGNGSPV